MDTHELKSHFHTSRDATPGDLPFDRLIAEVGDYAIILLNPDGVVTTWNLGANRIKGYASEEIIGRSHKVFYTKEDLASHLPERLLTEAAKLGKAAHEGWRVKKDGSRFWGNVAITALRDDGGNLIGFSKVTRDLSEQKNNEDKLSRLTTELLLKNKELTSSEERYHRMISEVQDYAIILLDPTGIVMNWNTGAELIKGYRAEEIIGRSFKSFYTDDDISSGYPDLLLGQAEAKGKASSEGWRKRKDGSVFWGSIVITALHDDAGMLIGFSKVTRDLTTKKKTDDELKRRTAELEAKNHELEKLNDELKSFAYVVSHDLKEPIRKIQVFSNRQIEPGKTIEQIKEYAGKITSSAVRMQSLMDALLGYSFVSLNPMALEKVDLSEMLAIAKTDLELRISEQNATISSEDLPVIAGIKFQLHQMFLNLLSNGLKFAKESEPPVIMISCKTVRGAHLPEPLRTRNRSYYQITFTDNGVGFEDEQSHRIFDVFQRLSSQSQKPGTGIGLAIVKKVALNHDGWVTASSEPGHGARFHVYFPIAE